jgi:gliding motility-associated-like protein
MWNQYFGDVSRPIFYSKSLDNGKSFQAGMPAIYTNNSNYLNEIFLGQITKEPDLPNKPEQFHFVFISAGGPTHNTYHKDIYHTIFRPENDHFYGMNGTDLGTSIDETELVANCIVLNTGTPLDSIYPSENNTVVVGDNQIPVINGKYRWDGSKFVAYTPNGLIPDSIDSYQWQNGKMFAFGGINPISVYESSDYGLNWTKIADMILPRRNPGGDQKTVPITYPSHPIARLWSKEVIPDLSENIVTVGGPGAKGIPDQIILKSRPVYVKSGDTCTISAFICDAENALVITADNPVVFNLTGQGALLGSGYVTASQGKALISYKAGSGSGSSIITATSPQLKSTYIEILFDEGGQPSDTTSPPDTTGNTQPPPDFELAISGVPNVFTPNGDGINETWIIPSIDNFPDAVIRIYDRNLKQIIQYNGLDPDWDGNDSNGNPMPAGAYLYLIDLNNGMRPTKGYISLIK